MGTGLNFFCFVFVLVFGLFSFFFSGVFLGTARYQDRRR